MGKTFCRKVRTQLQCHVDNVFLSWTWYQQKSGDINKRLHSLWCKAGIFADAPPAKNISCNIIRKSALTGLRESEISTGELQESTNLMLYSAQTAEKHYFIRKREKTASKDGDIIHSNF